MLKIYLTDLSAYNKGFLIGDWITLPIEQEKLEANLQLILERGSALCFMEGYSYEKHEEYFLTDFEWEYTSVFKVDEYANLMDLNSKLLELSELDEDTLKVVNFLLSENLASNISDAISKVDDVIVHCLTDLNSYAYDLVNELYDLDSMPSIITNNINYDGIAYELDLQGRYFEVDGDLFEYVG